MRPHDAGTKSSPNAPQRSAELRGRKVLIVVDGHHRLAAYQKAKHAGTISCQWFAGNARAAMDASVHRNEKVHYGNQLHGRAACVISATTRKTMVPLSPMSIMSCLISGN